MNRLNKFYAPKLHTVASKAELRADDRTHVMGGEITIAAPTGNTSTNVAARVQLLQVVPAAVPFTPLVLFGYLAKKSYEVKVEEVYSQGDYEEFLEESSQSRTKR